MPTRLQNVWYKTPSNYFMQDLGNDLFKSLKVVKNAPSGNRLDMKNRKGIQ